MKKNVKKTIKPRRPKASKINLNLRGNDKPSPKKTRLKLGNSGLLRMCQREALMMKSYGWKIEQIVYVLSSLYLSLHAKTVKRVVEALE